jgi:flagellin-like hook-associated protein FlgL
MSGVPPTVLSERSIASSSYDQAEEQKYRDKIQSEIESLKKEILRLQSRVAALGG